MAVRSSFAGDTEGAWASASAEPLPLERSREHAPGADPRPISVGEIEKWADRTYMTRTELVHAPIIWVFLPIAVLAFLIYGNVVGPDTDRWFGPPPAEPGDLEELLPGWALWIGVVGWLLGAIGVLVYRAGYMMNEERKEYAEVFERGVLCSLHPSPITRDDGEGGTYPTFIALDETLDEQRAGQIYRALRMWLTDSSSQALSYDTEISAEQLFGPQARGGWFLQYIPGFGSAEHFAAHAWVIITEPKDPADRLSVTSVPRPRTLKKVRSRLERRYG